MRLSGRSYSLKDWFGRDATAFVKTQLRDYTKLGRDGKFHTIPEFPEFCWTELIVNAVAHRDWHILDCPLSDCCRRDISPVGRLNEMKCECCGRETEVLVEIGAVSPKVAATGKCCQQCCMFILASLEDERLKLIERLGQLETDDDVFPEYEVECIRDLIGEY